MPPKKKPSTSEQEEETTSLLKEILDRLKNMDERMKKIEDSVSSIESSLEFHAETVREIQEDVNEMKAVVPSLAVKVQEQETREFMRSVEIQGVPYQQNEYLTSVISALAKKVDCTLSPDNIDLIYRNKSKKSIIVNFVQTRHRHTLLRSFKDKAKISHITAKDLGFSSTNKIYVNEHMPFDLRKLFHLTRLYAKDNDYKFVWTSNLTIYLRKTNESQPIRITSTETLNSLKE